MANYVLIEKKDCEIKKGAKYTKFETDELVRLLWTTQAEDLREKIVQTLRREPNERY